LPYGLTVEHTPLFCARATESRLVELWGAHLVGIPVGYLALADRGFAKDAAYYPNLNVHITPHFISGRAQFSSGEISEDRVCCELRYSSEVAFTRVTFTMGRRD
jgi:hypothetical protein